MRRVQEAGLTDLENQLEQADFASCHLINIEIAINSLLLRRKQQDEGMEIANELKMQNVLFHSAVAVSLSTSLPVVDHDERPHSHDVADYLNKRRHRQLSRDDGTTKTGTRHHPVAMLCTLQTCNNKIHHREGIQRSKEGRGQLLQASLQVRRSKTGYSTSL